MQLQELKEHLAKINIQEFQLDSATFIKDVPKFTRSHLSFLEANSGKKLFKPYYDRLLKLHILSRENEESYSILFI